jgi:hypothetical protein
MKKEINDKVFSPHLQLPLGFGKTDPGDIKRVQRDSLLQINRMIETISGLLENVHARDEVRNMALVELQRISKSIACDKPGSHIFKHREISE